MRKIISKILGNTEQSYYRWKEEGRLIIKFLENFQKEELQEFIETGQIKMLEEFKQFKVIKANDLEYNMFFTLYWLLTLFHFLHVWLGLLVLAFLAWRCMRLGFNAENRSGMESGVMYWHMIDLAWVIIFPLVYLLG